MKRRRGKSSSVSEPARAATKPASSPPPALPLNPSQFMQVAVQQHLADLRRAVATSSSQSQLASPSLFTANSNSNSVDRTGRPVTLPNKCIILGPGPAPIRRITDWESNNSQKPKGKPRRQSKDSKPPERHPNGKAQRRKRVVDTTTTTNNNNNNKRSNRRKKRPRIPPPRPHTERDLFYIVHLTPCQLGSRLLCPPPPINQHPPALPLDSLASDDARVLQRYREMQQQFNTGLSLSTLATLHEQLQSKYAKAIEILAPSTNPETISQINTTTAPTPMDGSKEHALTLRNEIAGLWILYAHVVLEIGLGLCQQEDDEQEQLQQRRKLQREQYQQSPSKQDQGINLTDSARRQQKGPQQNHETFLASTPLTTQKLPDQLERLQHQGMALAGYAQSPSSHEQQKQQQQQNQEKHAANSTGHQSPFPQTAEHALPSPGNTATLPPCCFHDVLKYVLAVLQAAGQCPMVGNHKYIALSLGRLMVVETVLGTSTGHLTTVPAKITMKSQVLRKSITDAIAVCHQTLDMCHGDALKNQDMGPNLLHHPDVVNSIQQLCNYLSNRPFVPNNRSDETWLTANTIKQDMLSILALPDRLRRKANMSAPLTKDSHTAKILCHEINRWCRLREKLEKRLYTRIAPCLDYRTNSLQTAMATQILDQFQFYQTMDCPTDTLPIGAKWTDLEYAPPKENGGLVLWTW